jgi:hypothetical protein
MSDEAIRALQMFLESTELARTIRASAWMWQTLETLHFIGMSVLIGTVGLFDLRLLGFARGVPYDAFHRLIPLGIAGFALNAATGALFLTGYPDQYLFNAAFQVKVALFLVAGLNVALFYAGTFAALRALGPDDPPPPGARVAGAVSLCAWIGVMAAGRLLTFFRGETGISFGA